MIHTLQAMRRAAELGCPDFRILDDKILFPLGDSLYFSAFLPMVCSDPEREKLINRHAGDVCYAWWARQANKEQEARPEKIKITECLEMIDLCEQYVKVYGGV